VGDCYDFSVLEWDEAEQGYKMKPDADRGVLDRLPVRRLGHGLRSRRIHREWKEHPDFQAHPGYTTQFLGGQVFPEDFPRIGSGWGFDGGKCVTVHAPVRAGDRLTAKSSIADIYEKTGRSGTMIFIVHRMVFTNAAGEKVSTVDWRLIQQPGR